MLKLGLILTHWLVQVIVWMEKSREGEAVMKLNRESLKHALAKAPEKPPRVAVPYETILKEIRDSLETAACWDKIEAGADYFNNAVKYLYQAEALIELLEVHNCGSVGGFDKVRGLSQEYFGRSLKSRVKWLEEVR